MAKRTARTGIRRTKSVFATWRRIVNQPAIDSANHRQSFAALNRIHEAASNKIMVRSTANSMKAAGAKTAPAKPGRKVETPELTKTSSVDSDATFTSAQSQAEREKSQAELDKSKEDSAGYKEDSVGYNKNSPKFSSLKRDYDQLVEIRKKERTTMNRRIDVLQNKVDHYENELEQFEQANNAFKTKEKKDKKIIEDSEKEIVALKESIQHWKDKVKEEKNGKLRILHEKGEIIKELAALRKRKGGSPTQKKPDRKNEAQDDVISAINTHIQTVLFRNFKFANTEKKLTQATELVYKGIEDEVGLNSFEDPVPYEDFHEIYHSHVTAKLSDCRQCVQSRLKTFVNGAHSG